MEQITELKSDKLILLDKICLYNFSVILVDDVENLQAAEIITKKEKQAKYVTLVTGETFSTLHIKQTEFFDDFFYGVRKNDIRGYIEMSVPNDGFHNLNCLTVKQYSQRIKDTAYFLQKNYGITVDFSNLKFKSMEINKTIILNHNFQEYRRPIALMMYLLPNILRLKEADFSETDIHPTKIENYRRNISTYTKSSGKKGISVKVYDKKKQLEMCFKIFTLHNYLRYEITLKSSTKIKLAFGDNSFSAITDELIQHYFINFIICNIVNPYNSHCKKRDTALRRILKANYEPESKTWTRDTLAAIREIEIKNGIPFMLEIEELNLQIGCLKIDNKQKRYNLKKRFIQLCEDQNSIFIQNDGRKYDELVGKLLF